MRRLQGPLFKKNYTGYFHNGRSQKGLLSIEDANKDNGKPPQGLLSINGLFAMGDPTKFFST